VKQDRGVGAERGDDGNAAGEGLAQHRFQDTGRRRSVEATPQIDDKFGWRRHDITGTGMGGKPCPRAGSRSQQEGN